MHGTMGDVCRTNGCVSSNNDAVLVGVRTLPYHHIEWLHSTFCECVYMFPSFRHFFVSLYEHFIVHQHIYPWTHFWFVRHWSTMALRSCFTFTIVCLVLFATINCAKQVRWLIIDNCSYKLKDIILIVRINLKRSKRRLLLFHWMVINQ